jgi:putative transcriptional regulator
MAQFSSAAPMVIRWKLNQLMFDREIGNSELAEKTGLHPNTISKLKNLRVMPRRLEHKTLDILCKVLCVVPADLLVYEESKESLDEE